MKDHDVLFIVVSEEVRDLVLAAYKREVEESSEYELRPNGDIYWLAEREFYVNTRKHFVAELIFEEELDG